MVWFSFAVLSLCAAVGSALYSSSDDVIELTPSNFDRLVVKSDEVWVVEFYAPWCGHCQSLVPQYKKAATALKGVVKVGAVDADAHGSLGSRFGIQGFPTLKVFGSNKNAPSDYRGARTADGIVQEALSTAQSIVRARLGGQSSSGGSSGGGSGSPGDVIELTDANFDSKVIDSDQMWLVEFYAPWCGHCKNLAPHWQRAATQLKGKIKLGALDATAHTIKASEYGVRGYPTIKFFDASGKVRGEASEYDGGRTAEDIVRWAEEKVAANLPAPEVVQLTSSEVLSAACDGKSLCVIAFLPHLLDCQSQCRQKHLTMLQTLGERFKQKLWGWLWSQGAVQKQLEESLDIGGFGYPAMVVVNRKKGYFATLRGAFSHESISEFLRDLSYGRGQTSTVRGAKLPEPTTVEPWDGKDGSLPVVEELDLSDVELEDLSSEREEL